MLTHKFISNQKYEIRILKTIIKEEGRGIIMLMEGFNKQGMIITKALLLENQNTLSCVV